MNSFNVPLRTLAAALVLTSLAVRPAQGQVVPPERAFFDAWRRAGCPEDAAAPDLVVNVRDFGAAGDGVADDQPAAVAAMAALGGRPGVVYFPAGTYLIRAPLRLPSGVVLRGERPATTTLRFDFVQHAIQIGGALSGAPVPVAAGAAMHDTVVQVAGGGGFAAGGTALLTQDNDPAWNITDGWAAEAAGQVVRIAAVNDGALTLESPLRHDYPLARNPRMRKMDPARGNGVENIRLERLPAGDSTGRNNSYTIRFHCADGGWVRGVESVKAFGAHVSLEVSTRISVTGCYFNDAHEHDGGGSGYGVIMQSRSGENLAENNILRRLRHALLVQSGANGNVFGYNYSRDTSSDSHPGYASDICLHGNYPYANLFEGNIVEHIWIDNSHRGRNGPCNTFFRNRAEVCGFNMTDPAAHAQNVIGNELFQGGVLARLVAGNGYRFQGAGHFTHGNDSEAGGLQPPGTETLADISYYLGGNAVAAFPAPSWWTIADALPVIGRPHGRIPEKRIPARTRWMAGGVLTVGPP